MVKYFILTYGSPQPPVEMVLYQSSRRIRKQGIDMDHAISFYSRRNTFDDPAK